MPRKPVGPEEAQRRQAQSEKDRELVSFARGMSTQEPAKRDRHDTALFLTVIFGLATVAAFLLQANGVITVKWLPSLFGYVVLLAIFCWAFLKWEVPHTWSDWKRWLLLVCCGAVIASLGAVGVTTQYGREHPTNEVKSNGGPAALTKADLAEALKNKGESPTSPSRTPTAAVSAEPSLLIIYNSANDRLEIHNQGKDKLLLWGTKVGEYGPAVMNDFREIPAPGYYFLDIAKMVRAAREALINTAEQRTNAYLFIEDIAHRKFTIKYQLWAHRANGQFMIDTQNLGTTKGWKEAKRFSLNAARVILGVSLASSSLPTKLCLGGPSPECLTEKFAWEDEVRVILRAYKKDPSGIARWNMCVEKNSGAGVSAALTNEVKELGDIIGRLR